MLIAVVQLLGGLILLVWGADRLVAGASVTARNLGVTPMVIGLTIVAYGTSAPELVVSVVASHQGQAGLAVGNVIGSNIANIGLILGVTALVHPLRVESATLKREYPQLLLIMLVCLLMAWNLEFSRMEGVILLCGLAALTWIMVWLGKVKAPDDPLAQEFAAEIPVNMPTRNALLWIVVGLLVLPLASHFLVQGSLTIARALNVSETVIGLTIVAIGTSLPEFATSLTSAWRKEDDLAIGNVIGSNMFNVLGVLGAAAVTRPLAFDPGILRQDIPVMLLFTALLFFLAYGFRGPGRIGRRSGLLLLSLFIAYLYMVWRLAGSNPGTGIG